MLFPVIHADCIRREQLAWFIEYRKLMVELMREVGFGIPVMPQGTVARAPGRPPAPVAVLWPAR